ncbi:MAG: LLM class F420-dependent oxidoreductase [Alphaproteobacteria bacterium]
MMQFSFRMPNADYLGFPATPEAILTAAQRAEELGFDAVLLNDHLIVKGNEEMVASWGNVYEPLTTMAYLAARTERIRLATSVLIMPYRNPVLTAKMVATLDQLSGGRIILGLGAGWLESEFAALAVSHGDRGARTDEYIKVCQACWGPDPVSFKGEYHQFEDMHCSPKPVQQPHPPIWIGGSSKAALRRAAEVATVWQPVPTKLEDLIAHQANLQAACDKIGRAVPPQIRMSFRINFTHITGKDPHGPDGTRLTGHGGAEDVAEDIAKFRDAAGLDQFQLNFNGCGGLEQLEESMTLFMEEVRPALEN